MITRPILESLERAMNFISMRQRDYALTFRSQSGQAVLKDLAQFCRASATTFRADAREHAVLEGRREVFLRIANHMNLSTEELYAIQGGQPLKPSEDANA